MVVGDVELRKAILHRRACDSARKVPFYLEESKQGPRTVEGAARHTKHGWDDMLFNILVNLLP